MKFRRPLRLGLLRLSLLAIIVGVITGFGAVLFRALIGFISQRRLSRLICDQL
jgi:hypothetical protein